ncbi:MAG TPA: PaaI family thioesterase [Actinospica sp.]|jgi:uncharacterized protein (TIGR00369 family)|nr:PaaI family thioesterase [Actinospica sp.]
MTDVASETPVKLPWLDEPRFHCFGCSPRNKVGLALKMIRLEDGRLASDIVFTEDYASYPGVVHGGIVSVLVDELMGDLIALDHGLLAFSVTLRTKFLEPLLVGLPYRAVASIVGVGDGILRTEADVLAADDRVVLMSSATYQPIRSEQATEHMGLDPADHARIGHYFDHQMG